MCVVCVCVCVCVCVVCVCVWNLEYFSTMDVLCFLPKATYKRCTSQTKIIIRPTIFIHNANFKVDAQAKIDKCRKNSFIFYFYKKELWCLI